MATTRHGFEAVLSLSYINDFRDNTIDLETLAASVLRRMTLHDAIALYGVAHWCMQAAPVETVCNALALGREANGSDVESSLLHRCCTRWMLSHAYAWTARLANRRAAALKLLSMAVPTQLMHPMHQRF